MNVPFQATLNAALNGVSAILLLTGYRLIKEGNQRGHRAVMLAALFFSAIFLISYLIYHGRVGSVPYPHYDWTRVVYFIILIPHIVLAGLMVPFILAAVWLALRGKYDRHRKLARWVWPVWVFVSLSGIIVYVMLYQL